MIMYEIPGKGNEFFEVSTNNTIVLQDKTTIYSENSDAVY